MTLSDRELVDLCLPGHLRALDTSGLVMVGRELRDRLLAGWLPKQIYELMDQPLPPKVSRLAGLVVFRLSQNLDVSNPPLSPSRRPAGAVARGAVVEDEVSKAWGEAVWEPIWVRFVGELGDYAKAYKASEAEVERRGLGPNEFRQAWNTLAPTTEPSVRSELVVATLEETTNQTAV